MKHIRLVLFCCVGLGALAGAGVLLYRDLRLNIFVGAVKVEDSKITFSNLSFSRPSGNDVWTVTVSQAARLADHDEFEGVEARAEKSKKTLHAPSGTYSDKNGLAVFQTPSGSWERPEGHLEWQSGLVEWKNSADTWSFSQGVKLEDHRSDGTLVRLFCPEGQWNGAAKTLALQNPAGNWERLDSPVDMASPAATWAQNEDQWSFPDGVLIAALGYGLVGDRGTVRDGQFVHLENGIIMWRFDR